MGRPLRTLGTRIRTFARRPRRAVAVPANALNPRLSSLVPAYNEEAYLPECLSRVLADVQRSGLGRLVEVLVVDNASTDRTSEVAGSFDGVRVVHEPSKGLTKARQKGLCEARGDIIAYVDADTRMPPGWITTVLETFAHDESVVCVSGPYIYYDASKLEKSLVRMYWVILAKPAYWFTRYLVVGGNFAAKKSALLAIGGFDTNIAFYGEDTNIARRLKAAGKVKFVMQLPMHTSARRLHAEGLMAMALKYGANFLGEVVLKRPVTERYDDVR
jgi:glycosyltransferase involved in cell wall biosynthesis